MEHEPSRFLSDLEVACNLIGTDAVFAIDDKPDSNQPFVERDSGVFKDAKGFDAELLVAILIHALPDPASAEIRDFLPVAVWAGYTIRPAHRSHELDTHIRIEKYRVACKRLCGYKSRSP